MVPAYRKTWTPDKNDTDTRTHEKCVSPRLSSLQLPSLLADKGNAYVTPFLTCVPITRRNRSLFRNVVFSTTSGDKRSPETQQSQKSVNLDHIHDTQVVFFLNKIDIFRFESEAYEQELNSTD
jgi:hypothetical protein